MMNNIKISLLALTTSLLALSCSEPFGEKQNDEWDEQYVWGVSDIAEGVLVTAYKAIPDRPDSYANNFLDAATDNATTSRYGTTVSNLATGNYSATDFPLEIWSDCYNQFQYINLFLENGLSDDVLYDLVDPTVDAAYKQRLEGEAYFLRAFWGFKLLQMYGGKVQSGEALGYPLALHFYSEEEAADMASFTRNTYEECITQILSDCDLAIELLPSSYSGDSTTTGTSNIGRATKWAAHALKSRVALYGASPAYQPDEVTQIIKMGEFSVVDSETYEERWTRAAAAGDEALAAFGYVFTALSASDLADATTSTPAEFLYRIYYANKEHETRHFPPYYYGNAYTVPSQNLVDAFPMSNGYPIDNVNSGYDQKSPYEGRDNRFYLNIYYHGAVFGTAVSDDETTEDVDESLQTEYLDMSVDGKDSPQYDYLGSRTGYYLAKFVSKDEDILDPINSTTAKHYYPLLRRTEIFLNFAEASNEAFGPTTKGTYYDADGNLVTCNYSAYDVIRIIRLQSGGITDTSYIDEMSGSKELFREVIQNERRIEMAFENQRYFDQRRLLLPLNEVVRGVVVNESESGEVSYNLTNEVDERSYNGVKYYYSPLPYEETIKCPNLVNNLGWE